MFLTSSETTIFEDTLIMHSTYMKNKITHIWGLIWSILFAIQSSALSAQAADKTDSIRDQILSNVGKERLEAYYSACMESATRNDVKDEISLLRAYEAEAARQDNADHEMQARTLRLYAFYNNNLPDSLNIYMDNDLRFFEQHKQWDYYYSCRSLRVERFRYGNQLQSALHEAQAMYENALRQGSNYGKGISAYLIASCYQNMDRNREAVEFFKQAESCLIKEGNVGQLHNVYNIAWESYVHAGQQDELLKMTDRWENMWKEYCQKNKQTLTDVAPFYLVCLLARTHAYIDKKELSSARRELDAATPLAEGQRNIARMLFVKEEARYAEAAGDYKLALKYLDECLRMQTEQGNHVAVIATQEMRARLLVKLGQTDEAALIYTELLPQKDSLSRMDIAAQLDDLSSIYKIDTLTMEKAQLRQWMIIAVVGCTVFLLLLVIYFYYSRRLQAKNHTLFLQYQKLKQAEEVMNRVLEQSSAEETSDKDVQLFLEIKKIFQDQKQLSDPLLDRNTLAEKLNTNHTYISNAVQAGVGMSVNRYINQMRVDYACTLLREKDKYTISEIQYRCGFQSRTSFNRAFKDTMQMSPTEFQKESGK